MVMAGSPSKLKQSSELSPKDQLARRVGLLVASGVPHTAIARQLGGGDPLRTQQWRTKIRRMAATNPHCQAAISEGVQGTAWLGLIAANNAMVARAGRGRMDAVKFLFALTGVYSEKQQVEHSGGIELNLNIGRPAPVTDRTKRMDLEEGIVDAEVVEEDDPGT